MKKLISATYIGDYQILLVYENEKPRIFDFHSFLVKDLGEFNNLKEESVFKQFKVLDGWNTLEWANGYDISPETLYEKSKPAEVSKVK